MPLLRDGVYWRMAIYHIWVTGPNDYVDVSGRLNVKCPCWLMNTSRPLLIQNFVAHIMTTIIPTTIMFSVTAL